MRRTLLFVLLLAGALFLAACGPEAEPAAVPTRTPRPTFTPTPVPAAAQPAEQPTVAVAQPAAPTDTPVVVAAPTDPPAEAPTDTPVIPTDTPAPQEAKAVINSPAVNVRSGPGTEYGLAGTAERGDEFVIQGKNAAGDWWQICCINGQSVWIASFLVDTSGPVDAVAVAANIPTPPPAPPTPVPQPAAPTATPVPAQPTQPPAPTFTIVKGGATQPRENSNAVASFFGALCKQDCYAPNAALGGFRMVVEGPHGRSEQVFEGVILRGDPMLESEFIYNAKVEVMGAPPGNYKTYVIDSGGNQVSEAWEYTVQGTTRTFLPRWIQP
ncbi:MAG: hypothetical protein KDD84_10600 [Caldilineaceae bacterium]|nr:hypothetical protein [Caldilineaceae bacterium]